MKRRVFAPALINPKIQDRIRPDAELHAWFERGLSCAFGSIDVTPRPIADVVSSLNIDVINSIQDDVLESLLLGWAADLASTVAPTDGLVPARRSLPEVSFLQALMYAVWVFAVWWMRLPADVRRLYQGDVEVLTGLATFALAVYVADRNRTDD